jgi:DNA-binding transcriptional LysR family regulator
MELRDIEYFAVIADHGNLARAAEALGLSQPALSKSLRRLESAVDAKLVRRTPKGVELTSEGVALHSRVRQLRLSLIDVTREISDLSHGREGHLRIGLGTGIAEYLLEGALRKLLSDAPKLALRIAVEANDTLMLALRKGDLDLVVSGIPAIESADLVQEHLYDDEFVVYASLDHPLVQRKSVTIADLAQARWAAPAANTLSWQYLRRAFEERGLAAPPFTIEANSTPLRLLAVACSDLLGFGSQHLVQQFAAELRLIALAVEGMSWRRRVGLSYRKTDYVSPALRRVIDMLKSTSRDLAHSGTRAG